MILALAQSTAAGIVQPPPARDPELTRQITDLAREATALTARIDALAVKYPAPPSRLEIFHGYMGIFVVSFLVAIFATPIMRRLAIANGVVDRPSEARKVHRVPIAYLGGVAVYLGILAGIVFAYTTPFHDLCTFHASTRDAGVGGTKSALLLPGGVPLSIILGMTVIMLCGLFDDVVGMSPRIKIAGMLFAAAALATEDVGVKVAAGLIVPVARAIGVHITTLPGGVETILLSVPGPGFSIPVDVVYWTGTAVIAIFVLGACNASNLIDGLDGLLSGTTAIANAGLLVIALGLAAADDGPLDAPRIVMCLAVLGACLGFLPHNFNPATIFLGDAGSLLLGFCTIVIVLMLGDTGKTNLVLAGLIIYAIPIIDAALAIVRRKMARKRISEADDQHLHHMLKRALGVKGAVFVLYGIGAIFAAIGIALSEERQRVTYALALVFAAFIGVIALKIGRREHIEREMHEAEARRARSAGVSVPSGAVHGAAAHCEPAAPGVTPAAAKPAEPVRATT